MAPQPKYPFGDHFQKTVLGLALREPKFLEEYGDVLRKDYFDNPAYGHLLELVTSYVKTYRRLPSQAIMGDILQDHASKLHLPSDLSESLEAALHSSLTADLSDGDWVREKIREFAQYQEMRNAILDGAKLLQNDTDSSTYDKIVRKIQKATDIGASRDQGMNLKDHGLSIPKYLKADSPFADSRRVGTGIYRLDKLMMGGLGPGEVGVVMGKTGAGKSMILTSFTGEAVRKGSTVFYYTLELNATDVLVRLCANLSKIAINTILSDNPLPQQFEDAIQKFSASANNVYVKYFTVRSVGVLGLRSHISYLSSTTGATPNLIVVDYADLLKTEDNSFNSAEKSEILGRLYEDLRALADQFRCPVWTASQTTRGGWKSAEEGGLIDISEVAESAKKMHAADAVLTFSHTQQEQVKDKTTKLYVAKMRRAESGAVILCKFDTATATIEDTVKPDEEEHGGGGIATPSLAIQANNIKESRARAYGGNV